METALFGVCVFLIKLTDLCFFLCLIVTEFHITIGRGHEIVQGVVRATHRALVTGLEVQTGPIVSIDHKVPDLTQITGTGVKIGIVVAGVGVITKTVIKARTKEIIGSDMAFILVSTHVSLDLCFRICFMFAI